MATQPSPAPTAAPPLALLTLPDVAARTSASVAYWRRQVRLRRIRAYRLGDLVRISEADLAAWLAAHAEPAEERR